MMDTEYNERQYRLMLDQLTSFEIGALPLDTLANNLEGLVNALEGGAESWKEAFLDEWATLDDARAYALFKGTKEFDAETTERLRSAVAKLRLYVLEKIDDPADRR
jgi:hypothetical protein